MKYNGVEYLATYTKTFHGEAYVEEDGSIVMVVKPHLMDQVERYIADLEKMARKAKLTLTVVTELLETYKGFNGKERTNMCSYRLHIETGCVNVPGYDFLGYVFPVETDDSDVRLDAVLVPNGDFPGSKEILSEMKQTQSVEKCAVCGKKIQRGIYFVFRKQEDGSTIICGKNCAKRYFNMTLSMSVVKFVSSFYNIPFGGFVSDDDEDRVSDVPFRIGHNYAKAVFQMGILMFGVARMQGKTCNPKFVDCIDNIISYLELDGGYPGDNEFLRIGKAKYEAYQKLFDDAFETPDDRFAFFKDMYRWYERDCMERGEFIDNLKMYALNASKGAFMRRGSLSLYVAAWVTNKYLDAHKEVYYKEAVETPKVMEDYPEPGTKLSGKFKVSRIFIPKREDDYYGFSFNYYDKDVNQTGAEIVDAEKGHSYYISLTKQTPCNYGHSMVHSRKYNHTFMVGEEIDITSARVKEGVSSDGKPFHKLTHLKINADYAGK